MSGNSFITETTFPTLDAVDVSQANKLRDLCRDMEGLMGNTNQKIQNILQNQQVKFFKAFTSVVETMFQEFQNLQKKFEEYVAYHENETEVVNAQNKLVFFRKECQVLSQICKELKEDNKQLKETIQNLKNDLYYQHMALIKQTAQKQELQQQLNEIKKQIILPKPLKPLLNSLKEQHKGYEFMNSNKAKQSRTLSTKLKCSNNMKTPQYSAALNKTFDEQTLGVDQFYSNSFEKTTKVQDLLDTSLKQDNFNEFLPLY